MKRIIPLILITAALSAQAASFTWGTGSVKVSFDGTALTTSSSTATGYLVLLTSGVSDLFAVDYTAPGTITGADSKSSKVTTSTGLATGKGRISGTYNSSDIANGQVYGMYITHVDEDGTTWFNFSSSTYTVEGLVDATSSLNAASFTFDFTTKNEIKSPMESVSAGGGWYSISVPVTPIPEPGTAAMALLGLGLLIRRRKA